MSTAEKSLIRLSGRRRPGWSPRGLPILPALLLLATLCLLALPGGTVKAGPNDELAVKTVRIGEHPDKTRLVLELTGEPAYRVFTLPDPARVVIDLPELDWRMAPEALPSSRGLIQAMRFGLFAPGTSRLVLDMSAPVGVKSVLLLPPRSGSGHRLVVDIEQIPPEVFADPTQRTALVSQKPLPAPQSAVAQAPPPTPQASERPTIVIDPGHGGIDPGAIGALGTQEKDLALTYAKAIKAALEAAGDFRVVLTRDEDIFLPLRDRFAVAQEVRGDLFLSIHANTVASQSDAVRGASIYTLSENASDKEAETLARKENLSDVIAGVNFTDQSEDVNRILIDLAQRETMNLSKDFAKRLVGELGRAVKLLRNTHRFAGFAVLKSPTVPSVLVEIGYISNAEEERLLQTAAHRERVSQAVVQAVQAYFDWQDGVKRS